MEVKPKIPLNLQTCPDLPPWPSAEGVTQKDVAVWVIEARLALQTCRARLCAVTNIIGNDDCLNPVLNHK